MQNMLISISKELGRRRNHKRAEKQPWPSSLLCGGLCQAMPGFLPMALGVGVRMDGEALTAGGVEEKNLPQKQNKKPKKNPSP